MERRPYGRMRSFKQTSVNPSKNPTHAKKAPLSAEEVNKNCVKVNKGKEMKSLIPAAAVLRYSLYIRAESSREKEDRREAGPTEGPVNTASSER